MLWVLINLAGQHRAALTNGQGARANRIATRIRAHLALVRG